MTNPTDQVDPPDGSLSDGDAIAAGLRGSLRALFRPVTREVEAVKGISFTVEEGQRVAFIGPNGAGKSTTIKMAQAAIYGWMSA